MKLNIEAIAPKSFFEAFDASNEPIAVTDAHLEKGVSFIYVNEAFCRETLYTKEELIGQNPKMLQGQKSNRALLQTLKERLKIDGFFQGQTTNYKKDGSLFYDKKTIMLLKDNEGNPQFYIGVSHDITKLKIALQKAHAK